MQEQILIVKRNLENNFLMAEKFKTDKDKRLFQVIRALIAKEKIKNASDLGRRIGENPQAFTDIKRGAKSASEEFLKKIYQEFPEVNQDFLENGREPMFLSPYESPPEPPAANEDAHPYKRDQIEELYKMIDDLKDQNKYLTQELKAVLARFNYWRKHGRDPGEDFGKDGGQ